MHMLSKRCCRIQPTWQVAIVYHFLSNFNYTICHILYLVSHLHPPFSSFLPSFLPLFQAVNQLLSATIPGATVLVLTVLVPTTEPTYAPSYLPTPEPSTATPTGVPSTRPTIAPTTNSQVLGSILGGIVGGMVVLGVIIGVSIYARKKERDKALKLSPLVTMVRPPKQTSIERSGEIIPSPRDGDGDDDDDAAGLNHYFDIEMQAPQESPRRKLSSESVLALSDKKSDQGSESSNQSRTSTGSITARTRALITFLEDSLMVADDDIKKDNDSKKGSVVSSTGAHPLNKIYPPFLGTKATNKLYHIVTLITTQNLPRPPFGVILGVTIHKALTEHPRFHAKLLLITALVSVLMPAQRKAHQSVPKRALKTARWIAPRPASGKKTTVMRTYKV